MHLDLSKGKCDITNYVMEGGVWKANVEISPNCPRCGSSNTKFCYYNNYSLTQPRYFCKGCRRYWTKGGSLRNVPVGGGCRKNRRGKSFRILTDRLASKGLASDPDPDPSGSALADSATTSSGLHDASASNIDLALVYANFLNQKPEPKSTGFEMPELPCEFHPSFQLSSTLSTSNTSLDSSHIQLPPDTHLSEDNQVYLSGFHPIHTHHDHDSANIYGLPPLPGQEVASPEMLWPISQAMVQNQTLHETQLPAPHPEAAQHPNHVAVTAGNWSPFDLSCYETFSRP